MKEIKAYIRRDKVEEVIDALHIAGVPGLTIMDVMGIWGASVPENEKLSIDYDERCCLITKIEIVCRNEDVVRFSDIIVENAFTGHRGDGMIFISAMENAVKIRTGEWGEDALLPGPADDSDNIDS